MTDQHISAREAQQIPVWVETVGPGWVALLDRLHHNLLVLDPGYRIESFGTKFGGLRLTVADRFEDGEFDGEFADRAAALTDAAETASERTCESCGNPGRIRLRGAGTDIRMVACCEDCRTAPALPRPPAPSGNEGTATRW